MPLSKNEIKFIRSLQQKKFRDSENLFIVEGVKMVGELLKQDRFQIKTIYLTENCILEVPRSIEEVEVSSAELEKISGLKSPNQVLAIVEQFNESKLNCEEENMILLLDEIKDPGNLGTIIRTADWFGISQVICSERSVEVYNPKVVQASMGAIFRVTAFYTDLIEAIGELKDHDFEIFGADMAGADAMKIEFPRKSVLVMGSESHGLSDKIREAVTTISIPKKGDAESLNVGMAAGILMAQYSK
jgi:TrmH family RNA methyltransferase